MNERSVVDTAGSIPFSLVSSARQATIQCCSGRARWQAGILRLALLSQFTRKRRPLAQNQAADQRSGLILREWRESDAHGL